MAEPLSIRFGAGRNTQGLSDEIEANECTDGENFVLTENSNILRPRGPLETVGMAPNGLEIRGYFQLEKQDGSLSTCIQAGDTVYEWDGTQSGFTVVTTVSSAAKLRGPREANFTLDNQVIVTDLSKVEEVLTWDGTTLVKMPTALDPDEFYAKYCIVENSRAIFANVKTTIDTPHLIAMSEVEDKNVLSTQRPSSTLNESDPVFITVPDLSPINGLTSGFGRIVFSTDRKTYYLTGQSAKDFSSTALFDGSGVSGEEALINIGNDIIMPREGVIDTLTGTDKFGNVASDDISQEIADEIADETGWKAAFDDVNHFVYLIPASANKCHVFIKTLFDSILRPGEVKQERSRVSSWSKYTTKLAFAFSTTAMWRMKDPIDGINKVYIGDGDGNLYQFEGDGQLDGGVNDIAVFRDSGSFSVVGGVLHDIQGYLKYRRPFSPQQATLTFQFSGDTIDSETVTIPLQSLVEGSFFGGDYYFGGDSYFGAAQRSRAVKHQFKAPSGATDLSVQVKVDATDFFEIEEIAFTVAATKARPTAGRRR